MLPVAAVTNKTKITKIRKQHERKDYPCVKKHTAPHTLVLFCNEKRFGVQQQKRIQALP